MVGRLVLGTCCCSMVGRLVFGTCCCSMVGRLVLGTCCCSMVGRLVLGTCCCSMVGRLVLGTCCCSMVGRLVLGWCRGNTTLFNWLEGWNLLGDDQNFKKGWESEKEQNQISRGKYFLLFYQSMKTFVTLCSCFSRYTLKERSLG